MSHPGRFVVFNPKIILAAILAATAVMAAVIITRGISFDGSPETLARNDSALRFYNEIKSSFGDDRVIIVALTTTDVFTPEFMLRLDRLTSRLAETPGVQSTLSLTNIKAIRRGEDGIIIGRLVNLSATGDENLARRLAELKQEVTRDPLYARHYVSEDGRTAAISVFINNLQESESRTVAEEVERVARSEAGPDELLLAGVPIMDARGIHSMVRDMLVCSPIAAVLCFLVFQLAFRSIWGGLLPTAALVIGLIWTIGLMILLGRPVTFATLPLPTVLLAVGSSYIFHVLNQYRISMSTLEAGSDIKARRGAWLDGLKFIAPAVIVSAMTTMAGFGALASSSIPTVRDMGLFEALGVLAMLILTVGFIPAALALLPPDALGRADTKKDYATWLNNTLRNITGLILYRRRAVFWTFLAVTSLIGAGAFWLRANTDYLSLFPSSSDTVQSARKLHERLAGAATIQVVVSGLPGVGRRADFLKSVEGLEKYALDQPGVDAAISVVDIVKRLNRVLDDPAGGAAADGIPDDPARLKTIYDDFLFQDDFITRLVSSDLSRMVVIIRTNLYGSNDLRRLTNSINEWANQNLPSGTSARPTGSIVLLNDASDAVADSQLSSLAIALVSIYMVMVALFRSFSTGLLALIPNLLPIVCYFGFLGWTGIPLDITTSLVASAALGLAVDNAVHMIRRYRQSTAERDTDSAEGQEWAMWLTMLRTGKPTVLANVMLMAAYLIFLLSSFVPVRVAGLLWAVTIFACLAADLVFLPVLMKSRLFGRTALGNSSSGPKRKGREREDEQPLPGLEEARVAHEEKY